MDCRYRNFSRRFFAAFIDGIVFFPVSMVLEEIPVTTDAAFFFTAFLQSFLFVFYFVYCHKTYGKTIGKMITSIEVVHVSESKRLSFYQAFLRDGLASVVDFGLVIYFISRGNSVEDNFEDYVFVSSLWGLTWALLELITMRLNKKGRAFHDLLGDSVVVRSNLSEVPAEQA